MAHGKKNLIGVVEIDCPSYGGSDHTDNPNANLCVKIYKLESGYSVKPKGDTDDKFMGIQGLCCVWEGLTDCVIFKDTVPEKHKKAILLQGAAEGI